MDLFAKYAVNKTDNEVQMIDNRLRVAPGGWQGVTEEELKHPDIVYALRKGWIELTAKEPSKPQAPARKPLKIINADNPDFSGEKEPRVKVSKIGA